MGRKAYWVSLRQPGCRNVTIFGPGFFAPGLGNSVRSNPKEKLSHKNGKR